VPVRVHPNPRRLLAVALSGAAAFAGAAAAKEDPKPQIRAYRAEADTYVTAAEPDTNYGRSLMLRVAHSPRTTTYLRFQIQKLPKDVTSVILLLHTRNGGRVSFEVRNAGTDTWAERRLTYSTAPRLSMRYAAGKLVRSGNWNAVDVTSLVAGRKRISLAVTTQSRFGVAFHSRESKEGPRLVVRSGNVGTDIEELLPL
jgi:hypothetical protein